jgi:hypothetical protein
MYGAPVATITLTNTYAGTIMNHSGFTIIYSLPIADALFSVGCSPDLASGGVCLVDGVPTGGTLTLTFTGLLSTGQSIKANDYITVTLLVDATSATVGSTVTATVTSFWSYGNPSVAILSTTGTVTLPVATVLGKGVAVWVWEGPENVLTCIGVEDVPGTPFDNDFSLRIKENWSDALTSLSDQYSLENNDANHVAGTTNPVVPTNGSNILITLAEIPPGVTVTPRPPIPCNPTRECIGGNLTFGAVESGPATADANGDGKFQQWFWYPPTTTNMKVIEWATFGFKLSSAGPLPPGQGSGITATVTLTDNYPYSNPTPPPNGDVPWWSPAEATSPMPVVNFFDCTTTLLFPYINTYGAKAASGAPSFSTFGTGIDIANSTLDPFALTDPKTGNPLYPGRVQGSATPQSGSCTFYFYPVATAPANTPIVFTTSNIPAGASYGFDVASQVPAFAGNTGYAIAVCDFQNAHGFVEIYDNYANIVAGPKTALAFEADILPDPAFYHRTPAGKGLGEGAIAAHPTGEDVGTETVIPIILRNKQP